MMKIKEKAILVDLIPKDNNSDLAKTSIEELAELVKSAGAEILRVIVQERERPSPAFFIGRGKAFEIAELAKEINANLVVFNHDLKPIQQRNLEDVIGEKIIDRTGIILDIFAQRARSKQGKLQVELAQLTYLLPRLAGKGTLLSRLGGGIGTRGPGEQKLEIDRRRIRDRIALLKKEIEHIREYRSLARKARQDVPIPVVAIVGYTNAGKSTLLNTLTNSSVFVEDKLFATLDPTTRKLKLPKGGEVLFTDTVGFIKYLPENLLTAFKATLEEMSSANILIHVVDSLSCDLHENMKTVSNILKGISSEEKPVITVFNKTDKIHSEADLKILLNTTENSLAISALKKEGIGRLIEKIEEFVNKDKEYIEILLPYGKEDVRSLIFSYGSILDEKYSQDGILIKARVDKKLAYRLSKYSSS